MGGASSSGGLDDVGGGGGIDDGLEFLDGGSGDSDVEFIDGGGFGDSEDGIEFLSDEDGPGGPGPYPDHVYTSGDGLPIPNEPGSVKAVMTELPFSLKETDRAIKAINAVRRDGYRYIGIDNGEGKLIRVLSQSDVRQLMGPFFGTKALTARDKAIYTVPIGKLNIKQELIAISIDGSVNQAADLVSEYNLRALPVVSKQGVLRGFVTVHGLVSFFRRKKQG
ncbi:putative CBS domain-containing protein [Magnetofaba australis IT-1]|uniref:Putative CBS domain-containing protein n=1 Tax=Magnetofaba australis IT-1 TaxID=1434232 RepID=A0A1Y2K7J2_9PROT|nr:putative CBS domain-containing protein [Magnetofaba australis IT-1]